jgi:RNA polymerase sigma-70 factor, ECF subfamily
MSASATPLSLLARLRDPVDAQAWKLFEQRYGDLILAYCRSRGLQPADAEDVRQMVLSKLLQGLRNFEYRPEAGGFRRYLRTVIRGEISRHMARHVVPPRQVLVEEDVTAEAEDESTWEQEWMRHHFRIAWNAVRASVEPASLEVFRLLMSGVSTAGVARTFGMTEPAVRKVKQRISERLRAAITQQLRDEELGANP